MAGASAPAAAISSPPVPEAVTSAMVLVDGAQAVSHFSG
jgi:hypothetical protein